MVCEQHLSNALSERYLKKLIGNTDVEDALQKLDKLTQEEARMAAAELLKITHSIDSKVEGMDNRVKGVDGRVQDITSNIQDVGNRLQDIGDRMHDVDDKVQGVDDRVQEVGNRVQDLDDKMDQVSCSSSSSSSILHPKHPDHREPAARQSQTMAFSSRPIHKLQHCNRRPSHRNHTVVLSRQYLQGLAIHRFILVDSWKSYVPLDCFQPFLLIASQFCSGLGKDHFLVCPSSPSLTSHVPSVLQSYEISWNCTTPGNPSSFTFILTSRMPTSKTARTYCFPSLLNLLFAPILVVKYSPTYILHTTMEHGSLVIVP